jgi:hypothetical protein
MPNLFPCPNPACTYQFDAEQLPAAAMVTCPICRTRFPYRAAPVAPAPMPAPVDSPSTYPDDYEFGSRSAEPTPSARPNRLVTLRNVPKSSRSNTALLALGGAVVVATILLCVYLAIKNYRPGDDKKPEEIHTYPEAEGNFKFKTYDTAVWNEDGPLKASFKAVGFVIRRKDPDAWVVVHYHDFKNRNPRPEEMRNELYDMLRRTMREVQKEPMPSVKIGDAPAEGIHFTGTYSGKDIYGEAFSCHHQGIGYALIFFSTSAEWDKAKKELEEFRNSFAFGDARKDWTEKGSPGVSLFEKDKPYQLSDTANVWTKARILAPDEQTKDREFATTIENLKAHDDKATMMLRLVKDRDGLEANAIVLELDKAEGDPQQTARTYVQAGLAKADPELKITFEPAAKTVTGVAIPKSEAAVAIYRYSNDKDKTARRYYAISALPLGEKLIVAVAWCKEIDAELFEGHMLNLVASLRERR